MKPAKPPTPPAKPPKERNVHLSGGLTLSGLPPPGNVDVTVHGGDHLTIHHVFDTPLHVIVEQAPPAMTHITLTLKEG